MIQDASLPTVTLDDALLTTMDRIFDPIPVPIILVDKDSRVVMINEVFANYLQRPKEEILGEFVVDVDKNTRFPYVLKTKKAEIAWRHKFENGHTAIVHRIPVLDEEGEVLYGFGLVLFQDLEEFREIIKRNKQLDSELFHIRNELKRIQGAKYSWENVIGSSEKMLQAKYMGRKAAMTTSSVLLLGDSGTGKELFAHAIHNDSGRSFYPFIKVNCAAIPHELLESELFGYEDGAFTGAKRGGKIGKFELANNGTIFLDEIGDMPMDMQVKLLRVLQEREIERIGGNETIQLDLRVIAATNKNLLEEIENGNFREDLYYRLNVVPIDIPPLRERLDDLPQLVDTLMKKVSNQIGKYVTDINEDCMKVLSQYHWPGNVRELENVLERAINMSDSTTLFPSHLPIYLATSAKNIIVGPIRPLKEAMDELEKQLILDTLKHTKWNKKKTADLLQIGRSSLYEKMAKHQIEA